MMRSHRPCVGAVVRESRADTLRANASFGARAERSTRPHHCVAFRKRCTQMVRINRAFARWLTHS
eukprot:519350-Lingulodinium_polyedra.AAC.1